MYGEEEKDHVLAMCRFVAKSISAEDTKERDAARRQWWVVDDQYAAKRIASGGRNIYIVDVEFTAIVRCFRGIR